MLIKPEKDGFTPFIFMKDLDEDFDETGAYCELLDPETGICIVVKTRRVSKVSEDI